MFAPPARVARRLRDMRCTYCLDAAAVSGSHTRRLTAGHSAEGRGAISTTSGARASGSTALSLAALWHHGGSVLFCVVPAVVFLLLRRLRSSTVPTPPRCPGENPKPDP